MFFSDESHEVQKRNHFDIFIWTVIKTFGKLSLFQIKYPRAYSL